jgi:hypothetical protein
LDFDGSNDYVISSKCLSPATPASTTTILIKFASIANNPLVFASTIGAAPDYNHYGIEHAVLATGVMRANWGTGTSNGAAGRYSADGTNTVSAGVWYLLTYIWDSPSAARLYINGVQNPVSGYSGTGAVYAPGTNPARLCGTQIGSPPTYTSAQVAGFWFWDRALGSGEVASHAADPSGLVRPARKSYLWVTAGGAEAQTVAVSLAGAGPTAYAPTAIPGSIAALPAAASRTPIAFNPTAAPGSITASPSVASRSVAAFDATSSPGAVSALPSAASRTAQAFTPTAVLGAVTASPDFASRVAQAFEASAATGVLTADVGVAARTAQAFAPTALPGSVIAEVQAALREAVALQAVALVGSTIVTVNAAQRTATAYAVVGVPGAIIALPETASRIARAFTARIAGIGDTGWMLVYLESGRYI